MEDSRMWILLGTARVHAETLKRYLQKAHYWIAYDRKTAQLSLWANHGDGGGVILEADQVPFETAERFAKELGLYQKISDGWSKWNPSVRLYSDGSRDALELKRTILELGIPLNFHEGAAQWEFSDGHFAYHPPTWTKNKVVEIIREIALRYQKDLSTLP
ncbi:MAG: hypothetical protein KGI60_00265 [Patescibacteria group bacterium]|nr:hypothetical protein [Patescibacteria group bacterium]